MTEPTNDKTENWVFLTESAPRERARANRPHQITTFIIVGVILTLGCCIWWLDPPTGERPGLPLVVTVWLAGLLLGAFVSSRMRPVGDNTVLFGQDFVVGSIPGATRGMSIILYPDIVGVTLDLSRGRITGAIIRARRMNVISARAVQHPAIVVRAILEHAPENVKWRRAKLPFTRLSREQVRRMIEEANLPDISRGLPPGATFVRADTLSPKDGPNPKGLLERLFAERSLRSVRAVSLVDSGNRTDESRD